MILLCKIFLVTSNLTANPASAFAHSANATHQHCTTSATAQPNNPMFITLLFRGILRFKSIAPFIRNYL